MLKSKSRSYLYDKAFTMKQSKTFVCFIGIKKETSKYIKLIILRMEYINMNQLSRNEKIAHMRKNNKKSKSYKPTNKSNSAARKNSINPTNEKSNHNLHNIHQNHTEHIETSSFQIRIFIAAILLLIFLGIKEHQVEYGTMNYKTILEVISNNSTMELAQEKIILLRFTRQSK